MRTVTLGVLIVAGGTLASLPFRRYQSIPDASSGPTQATGPTQSELRQSNFEKLEMLLADKNDPLAAGQVQNAPAANQPLAMLPTAARTASVSPPGFAPGQANYPTAVTGHAAGDSLARGPITQRRSLSIPLTYEDLVTPIDQPEMIRQNYNATAAVNQERAESERAAELVMPRMDSLALSQQQEINAVVTVVDPQGGASGNTRVSTQFASSSFRPSQSQTSEVVPPTPERHWIRQPD